MLADVAADMIMIVKGSVSKEAPDGVNALQRFDVEGIASASHNLFVKVAAQPKNLAKGESLEITGEETLLLRCEPLDYFDVEAIGRLEQGGWFDHCAESAGLRVGGVARQGLSEAPAVARQAKDPAFGRDSVEEPQ